MLQCNNLLTWELNRYRYRRRTTTTTMDNDDDGQHTLNLYYYDTKYVNPHMRTFHFAYNTGIPICKLFSNPHTFAYGDPHMHTAIPVWEITHMGIQDLISHMEIFPVYIWLVTEISPYAYGDYMSCDPRMHTGISAISLCIWGLILIPVCIQGSHDMQSPYAYRDSLDPHMHTGIDLDPCMYTGISCFGRGVCLLCICKILIQRATHVKVLIQRVT